ncbi:DNA-directed RNA polymerase subunit omega [Candidatus Marinimicrobia bacterium]|nr:DNA-directed RNA polymerase subunit omega [Candidatus Neomarinimicrobiota bacterium]
MSIEKIEAVKMNELLSDENDIYKTVMIIAKRARQVIDKRFSEQIDLDEIDDTEELVQISKEDFDKVKPIMKAYNEFLGEELKWSDMISSADSSEK